MSILSRSHALVRHKLRHLSSQFVLPAVAAALAMSCFASSAAKAEVIIEFGSADQPYFCGDNGAHDLIAGLQGGDELFEACGGRFEPDQPDWEVRAFEVAASLFNYWIGSNEFYPSGRKYRFESDADVSQFLILVSDAGGFSSTFETPVNPPPPDEFPCLAGFWICWTGESWRHDTFFRVYDPSKRSTYVRLVDITEITGEVSEPAAIALLGSGLLGLAAVRRRKKQVQCALTARD